MDSWLTGDEAWRKSSYTADQSTCVEVGRNLRKSVVIRDSKDKGGPRLAFTPVEWKEFIRGVINGR
jgi:Domain of unknown function (DUF397)